MEVGNRCLSEAGWAAESYVRAKTSAPVEVVPDNGLHVRSGPSVNDAKVGAFADSAVLQPTGREMKDDEGRYWIEVAGVLPTGETVTGWVASEYMRPSQMKDALPLTMAMTWRRLP
jgi:hypothetical protein